MKLERSMLVLNIPWGFKRGGRPGGATPIRYRASRVYFGVRYYRGVDFIVNIYEGGSPGCVPAFSSLHRRRHRRRHRPSCYRLLLGAVAFSYLLALLAISIYTYPPGEIPSHTISPQ